MYGNIGYKKLQLACANNCTPKILSIEKEGTRYSVVFEKCEGTLEDLVANGDKELLLTLLENCREKTLLFQSLNVSPWYGSDSIHYKGKEVFFGNITMYNANDAMKEFEEMKESLLANTYTKEVSRLEMEIYRVASLNGIAPEIVSIEGDKITTKKYPKMLARMLNTPLKNELIDKAKEQLMKLHSLGILHRDLSEENVVVSVDNQDVRLIDFGMSSYLPSKIDIKEVHDVYYEGVKYAGEPEASIEYLFRLELGCLEFLR